LILHRLPISSLPNQLQQQTDFNAPQAAASHDDDAGYRRPPAPLPPLQSPSTMWGFIRRRGLVLYEEEGQEASPEAAPYCFVSFNIPELTFIQEPWRLPTKSVIDSTGCCF